ncbi:hypothetical protein PGB90_006849 [Kerria lacca]
MDERIPNESKVADVNFASDRRYELENEIVYGPSIEENKKNTFWKQLENYYLCIGCWTLTLFLFWGPTILLIILTTSKLWIFGLIYLMWMYYDKDTPHNGGRRISFLRKIKLWRYRRDYFPVRLVKTAELPPDTTYLFASFPHGIFVFGATTNFMSDVNNFDGAFPGLNPYIVTLNSILCCPLTRDVLLAFGVCAASKEGITKILEGPPGNVCVVVVGGVAEALKSQPETYKLVLKNRKGFVKLALETGSSLVPVFSFGETNTYDQVSGKWYLWLQHHLRSIIGLPLIFIKGRSFLFRLFTLLPYKRSITTVVGKPIKLPKEKNPSQELIDKYHRIFVEEITNLFHKYKGKYDVNGENATLSIETTN